MKRLILGLGVTILATAPAHAERLVGLTSDNRIVTFDSAAPGTIQSSQNILGLGGDTLLGIDLRATDRAIYGLGSSGSVYRLNFGGGGFNAVDLGSITTALDGSNFDIDFNPAADRLRTSSNTNQSLRLNVDSGPAITTIVDGSFSYGEGGDPAIVGAAYTNNRAGATSTQLFVLDAARNQLTIVNPPNDGNLTSPLALSGIALVDGPVGFDISGGTGAAFVAFDGGFYTLDLGTGQANLVGGFGNNLVTDITAVSVPEPASWAMMIAGFGLMGTAIRRRPAPRQENISPA